MLAAGASGGESPAVSPVVPVRAVAPAADDQAAVVSTRLPSPEVSARAVTRSSPLFRWPVWVTDGDDSRTRDSRPEVMFRGAARSSRPFRWPALVTRDEFDPDFISFAAGSDAGPSRMSSVPVIPRAAADALFAGHVAPDAAGPADLVPVTATHAVEGCAEPSSRPDPFAVLW